jgi:hypothetical protein
MVRAEPGLFEESRFMSQKFTGPSGCRVPVCLVIGLVAWVVVANGHAFETNPATPFTDQAVEHIRRQAEHMARGNSKVAPEFFSSLAAANYVQSRLSSLNYSILGSSKQKLPTNVEECLKKKAGICGNHVATFLEISRRLGLRARPVEFYFHGTDPGKNHSHICAEVFYGGRWRLFDITWGTYFAKPQGAPDDLADVVGLRANRDRRSWAITNQSDLWYQQWKASGLDPLEYLDDQKMDILRGRRGTIHLRVSGREGGREEFRPVHQPNFFGRNQLDRDFGPLVIRLEKPAGMATALHLDVLGKAGRGSLLVTVGKQRHMVPFDDIKSGKTLTTKFTRPIGRQPVTLQAISEKPGGIAYVVFRTITLETR